MKVMESGEDYLETILVLEQKGDAVRLVEIVAQMKVSKASVSVAMKNFREGGCIYMDETHEITLTPKGRQLAELVYERHVLFSDLLCSLGVRRETALQDACHMERAMSAESFEALKGYFLEMKSIEAKKDRCNFERGCA